MTSLFFVMLVMYIISFAMWQKNKLELLESNLLVEQSLEELKLKNDSLDRQKEQIIIQAEKFKIIEAVEKNLEALKKNKDLFIYEPKYHRYTLSFDVKFEIGESEIREFSIDDYDNTITRLEKVANELKSVINALKQQKSNNPAYKNISYLIVVSGSASNLGNGNIDQDYMLSYSRAYNLYKFWKNELNVDFDANEYHDLIEFQIAGNGIGGIGRYNRDEGNGFVEEEKNQRFLINIIPKIGEIK